MHCHHFHITGRVQGVGFRPFVYQLATAMDLNGTVYNGNDGVHIRVDCDESMAEEFGRQIRAKAPDLSVIEDITAEVESARWFADFQIIESEAQQKVSLKVSPDFAMCQDCRVELTDPANRRYGYAFITCTQCGPRYSVMNELPYDRPATSMHAFDMCHTCQAEYDTTTDRRYFSQTNSCPDCGIEMTLYDQGERVTGHSQTELIDLVINRLRNGDTVAMKGIGGYLLLCDAASAQAVTQLRTRKHRPHKPFALLYPHVELLGRHTAPTEAAVALLNSPESPIVLLPYSTQAAEDLALEQIAPGLNKIGVMLPYAPLLQLIASGFDGVLVATSANLSGSPIIFKDEQALTELGRFADLILTNNREIITPQDDSVVRLANDQAILLRRSRGYAPAYYGPSRAMEGEKLLALGAQMKGSVALANDGDWHISQYLGSLDGFESQEMYKATVRHLTELFLFSPDRVLTDAHPGYFTHEYAKRLGGPVTEVQHHEAHFAAVLQENDLLDYQEPILGVIWDGTGLGDDQQIWGGEFFRYQEYEIARLAHLNYAPQLAGDKMAKEPRLSGLAFFHQHEELSALLEQKFSKQEWAFYQKLVQRPSLKTSSIGRLFDAVACLLGLVDKSTYEGQAAIMLEELAERGRGLANHGYTFALFGNEVSLEFMSGELAKDLESELSPAIMAYKFHLGLVDLVQSVVLAHGINTLAFSGGVFQNALLVELIHERLNSEFNLFFHKELSPNDENVSYGQLAHFFMQQERTQLLNQKSKAICV